MQIVKLKLNYGTDFRIFDLTIAVVDAAGRGYVFVPAQMETERLLSLSPGVYLISAYYDLFDAGNRRSCVYERRFDSSVVKQISVNFRKPTGAVEPFSEQELQLLRSQLSIVGNRINARPQQVFVSSIVKQLPAAYLEERVVVDKNGRVDYEFNYVEQEVYDLPEEQGYAPTVDYALEVKLRPFSTTAFNYGDWNVRLYGVNVVVIPSQKGYRKLRASSYLRPRQELFKQLQKFIDECSQLARKLNDL
ncbi:MAG: hypothetical protein RMM17_00600 [Acidobacteriota bacterium]|nr:hypothetical protein [Blastocatellia bacterium]MDW8411166.1 hypothetical protein [Acidobacteriota bacterium]